MTKIPPHAERMDFDTIYKYDREASKHAPNVMAVNLTVECPSCQRRHPMFHATETLTCECGLLIACEYGITYIWRDVPQAAE